MSNHNPSKFSVEALESRILLSATPLGDPFIDEVESAEDPHSPLEEAGEGQVEAGSPQAEGSSSSAMFEGALVSGLGSTALSVTSLGDGETVEPSIFRAGSLVVESGATHTLQSTEGGIFLTDPGALDGTSPASTQENVRLISATEVSIEGRIGGASPLHNLTISANSNVFFGGSIVLTGDLIIEKGAQVTFSRDVTVQGNLVIGDRLDPSSVAGVVFGLASNLNVGGEIQIYTEGTVDFNNRVGVSLLSTGITVAAGGSINVEQDFFASSVDLEGQNVTINRALRASGPDADGVALRLTAFNLLSVRSVVEIAEGNAVFTANRVSFMGGEGSILSAGTASELTIKPFNSARSIGIGDPTGGDFTRLQISHIELNAINTGFSSVVIGDIAAGTGEVKVGNIGLARATSIAQIQNSSTFVGGSVIVESRIDVDVLSGYLRLVARDGDVVVNGAVNESVSERNGWVRLEASRDIFVNRPIFALDRISLSAGYSGGQGSVYVQSFETNSGILATTSAAFPWTERRIEISAGAGGGDVVVTGQTSQASLSAFGSDGSIVVQAPNGAITQTGGLIRAHVFAALSSDDISISAAEIDRIGEVTIAGSVLAAGSDRVVNGVEITGAGSLTLLGLDRLVIDNVETTGGDIDISNLVLSGGDLALGRLDAGGGAIRLEAAGAILDDLPGLGVVNLATGGNATLIARNGIGGAGGLDLDTDLGSLSARNLAEGGIFLQDRSATSITGFLETLADNGSIAVTVEDGNLSIDAPVLADGTGNVLLRAAGGNLVLSEAVRTGTGHVTLQAEEAIILSADAAVSTASDGSILLRSENGPIAMAGEAVITTADSNVRLEAGGDVVLGNVIATRVAVVSGGGSILNAVDSTLNVVAEELRLEASNGIGASDRRLTVTADRVAAYAGGGDPAARGIFLAENSTAEVGRISPIDVERFSPDGNLTTESDATALVGLATGGSGNIALTTGNGAVTVAEAIVADGAGNVRIEAGVLDLLVNSDIFSDSGSITLVSGGVLTMAASTSVSTGAAGSILARANGGALTMDGTALMSATGSGIRLLASTEVVVGQVRGEDVSILAEDGSIFSAAGSVGNITAGNLRLFAHNAIGTALFPLLTTVALVSAQSLGTNENEKGIYLLESNGLGIGLVGYTGSVVGGDGSVDPIVDPDQSGVFAFNGGDIRVELAEGDISLLASHFVSTATGSIELDARNGAIILQDGTGVETETGDIELLAEGDIRLSAVSSDSGDLAIRSRSGSIIDNTASELPNLATGGTADLVASTGIGGIGADDINTRVGTLTASNSTAGLIVVREESNLVVGSGGIANLASGGSVLVETADGSLVVQGPILAETAGKILLRAGGLGSNLTVQAPVTAEQGAISLIAAADVVIEEAVLARLGGTIDLLATGGNLLMDPLATVVALDSDIRLSADNNVTLTGVDAGVANVHVSALNGSILDGGNHHDRDLIAAGVRLSAAGSIGGGEADPLNIEVARLAAVATTGSIHVSVAGDVVVGTVPVVSIDRVGSDNETSPVADLAPTSDLVAEGAGDVSLISEAGSILVEDGILADDSGLRSAGGNISLQAAVSVSQDAGISTLLGGKVAVTALAGGITMTDGTETTTVSGEIAYTADGDILLSLLESQTGSLILTSGNRIIDNTAGEVPNLVTAGHAKLVAENGIGDIGSADINTHVGSLSATNKSTGRIVVEEKDGLVIGDSGLETLGGGGDIILTVREGVLEIEAPVAADAGGNVLLQAVGASADIRSNADVASGSGHITISARRSLDFGAGQVTSGGVGTIDLQAVEGSIVFDGAVLVDGGSGDIRLAAIHDVQLGGVKTEGNVLVQVAVGSILSNGDTHVNIAANGLRLEAAVGIGVLGVAANPLTTDVGLLSARATSGGINILESTSVQVSDVSVSTQKVNADATFSQQTGSGSDVITTAGNGAVVLRTLDGSVTLSDGVALADNVAIRAHGSGNILVEARGDGAAVLAQVDLRSTSGAITVLADGSVEFAPGADILTSLAATIHVEARAGSVVMDDTTRFNTGSGDIHVAAGLNVLVGGISTSGNVAVLATNGSILDNGDTRVDINANGLLMNAGQGVGSLGAGTTNAIETTINTLTSRAGAGGVNVREANNLTVGDVTVTTSKVGADGAATQVVEVAQSDVRTVDGDGSIVLRLTNGSFVLEPGSFPNDGFAIAAHGAGNVLIETLGIFTDIFANGGISSEAGNISLNTSLQIFLGDGAEIRTGESGTIDVVSRFGFVAMQDGSLVASESGGIRLWAQTDILLGGVRSGGNVSIISEFASILDNGDTYLNIEAAGVRLNAHTDIGILVPVGVDRGPDSLEIQATSLTAHASFGDINIHEQTSVRVDAVAVLVNRVGLEGTTTAVLDGAQADVRTFAENGSIVLTSGTGDIVLNDGKAVADNVAVSAHGAGNVLIQAGRDVVANASIQSTTGHITVVAAESVELAGAAGVVTSGSGTIHVVATAGDVTQAAASRLTAIDGDIRVFAEGSISIGEVETKTLVSLIAQTGSILDGGNTLNGEDVIADQVRMVAGTGIGDTSTPIETRVNILAARAGSGGVFVDNNGELRIDSTNGAVVQQVNLDNTLTVIGDDALSDVATVSGNGSIVLRTSGGSLFLNDGGDPSDNVSISAHGSGNILLQATTPGTSVEVHASILSGSGHVTVLAALDVLFICAVEEGTEHDDHPNLITGGGGSVNIEAADGSVVFDDATLIQSGTGAIRVVAAVDVLLGGLETTGNVSITAQSGSILDNGDVHTDVVANGLRMVAGIGIGTLGAGANPIETTVGTVSARATSGGINLFESTGLAVDDVEVTVQKVMPNGSLVETTDVTQSDLATTAGDGSIVLRAAGGDIVLGGGSGGTADMAVSAHGGGNVLIEAFAPDADISATGGLTSGTGHISVVAARTALFMASAQIATGGDGTLLVTGVAGDVSQADGSRFEAEDGDVRLLANGTIRVGEIATNARVSLIAETGSILDSGDSTGPENITAAELRLVAGLGVGSPAQAIDTDVATVSGRATSGGIFLRNTGALVIADTAAEIERVLADASLSTVTDKSQSDLVTTSGDGSIMVRTLSGGITLNDGAASADNIAVAADGSGNILLHAGGVESDLAANAEIRSGTGHVTLVADRAVQFAPGADLTSGGSATLNVEAAGGSIVVDDATLLSTDSGAIRLHANLDVIVGGILTTGNVSITAATGSILGAGNTHIDVVAAGLRLATGNQIGTLGLDASPLQVTVATLSARADSGSINILETDAIQVDGVEVTVERVNEDVSVTPTTDALQSDLIAAGSIILRTLDGAIVLNDGGSPGDGRAIHSTTSGSILVQTQAAGTGITANADIRAHSGDVSVISAEGVTFNGAKIELNALLAGTINVEAADGSILMQDSQFISGGGNIRLMASQDVGLGEVRSSFTGNGTSVAVTATNGSILNQAVAGTTNFRADNLRLLAGGTIGTLGAGANEILADVATMTALAAGGGIHVVNQGALTVDAVGVVVNRVNADASLEPVFEAVMSDVETTGLDGSIVLRTMDGDLTLNDGAGPGNGAAVAAHGTGNVLVEAGGETGDLFVNADVSSGSGHITLQAGRSVEFAAGADVATTAAATINMEAESGSIRMDDEALVSTGSGDIRLTAKNDVLLGGIVTTGQVLIVAELGSVLDNGDTYTDIVADGLQLVAGAGVGTLGLTANPLDTRVNTLTARAGLTSAGDVNILEETGLVIGTVSVTTEKVGLDGSTSSINPGIQSDILAPEGSVVIRTTAGSLIVNDGPEFNFGLSAGNNILLKAQGAESDVVFNARVISSGGHLTISGDRSVLLHAAGELVAVGLGSINVEALSGLIGMADASRILGEEGSVRLMAEGDISLGGVATSASVSILSASGSILTSGDTYIDVQADGLRLEAGVGIGTLGGSATPVVTEVTTLSGKAAAGGINLLETSSLVVDDVEVTVTKVAADGSVADLTDAAQSDVRTTEGHGSIILRTLNGGIALNDGTAGADNTAVEAHGSGSVRIEANGLGAKLEAAAAVVSETGHLTLLAVDGLSFQATAHVTTGGAGTVHLATENGGFSQADGARVTAGSGDVRIVAEETIELSGVTTAGTVSLISLSGAVLNSGTSSAQENVIATQLRIAAAGAIGSAAAPIEIQGDRLSARNAAGGIYLLVNGDLAVDAVAAAVETVLIDGALERVADASQSDLRAGGDGDIVVVVDGELTLNDGDGDGLGVLAEGTGVVQLTTLGANDLIANAGIDSGAGDLTLVVGRDLLVRGADLDVGGELKITAERDVDLDGVATANGDIEVMASTGSILMTDGTRVISVAEAITLTAAAAISIGGLEAPGDIRVTAADGAITSAGTANRTLQTDSTATLSAALGMGRTGAGSLSVRAPELKVVNTVSGSVYLTVDDSIELNGADLAGLGSLNLAVRGGGLTLTAPVEVAGGAALLQVSDALLLAAEIRTDRDLRIIAHAVGVSPDFEPVDAILASAAGNIQVRAREKVTLPAGSLVEAAGGTVQFQSGDTLTVGLIQAGELITLRTSLDLIAASLLRSGHELQAPAIQLFAQGDLGKPGQPILTTVGRLDFEAGGYAEVLERDDLEIGRFGVRLADAQPGDELLLRMEGGDLTAVGDVVEIPGLGDFILRSEAVVTLGTQLLSPDGNIIIDTYGLRVKDGVAAAVVQAPNGSLSLQIGDGELGPGLSFSSGSFDALIGAGDFTAEFVGTVRIGPDGIQFADGEGAIDLKVTDGNLDLSGVLRGTEGIKLDVGGSLNVLADAPTGPVLDAGTSSVSIKLGAGVSLEVGDHVEVLAGEFSAVSGTGDLAFSLNGPLTEIGPDGVQVQGGIGAIDLRVPVGNVQIFGDIRHDGEGPVSIAVENGSFVMEVGSRISLAKGALLMEVRNLILISEIFNQEGSTTLVSTHNSILRQSGLAAGTTNITTGEAAVFRMSGTINLLLDSDSALVNGKLLFRGATAELLLLSGTFRS